MGERRSRSVRIVVVPHYRHRVAKLFERKISGAFNSAPAEFGVDVGLAKFAESRKLLPSVGYGRVGTAGFFALKAGPESLNVKRRGADIYLSKPGATSPLIRCSSSTKCSSLDIRPFDHAFTNHAKRGALARFGSCFLRAGILFRPACEDRGVQQFRAKNYSIHSFQVMG